MGSCDPIFYLGIRTLPRLFQHLGNQKTDLHEHTDKKICRNTNIRNKSRNTLRLAYVNWQILTSKF